MLKLNKILLGLGLAFLVTGCASTGSPDDLGELQYTGFSEKSDGTAHLSVMGMSCPNEIDGMARISEYVYNDRGTDASCTYSNSTETKSGDRLLTVYLSQYPQDSLGGNFQNARAAIESRDTLSDYQYDEDLSDRCSSVSLDEAALLSGFSGLFSGENKTNEITLTTTPSAVYVTDTEMSFVVVEEMFDKEFFKVRYTGPYSGEASVKEKCQVARDTYLSMKRAVEKDRGIEISKEDRLLDLINASDDS